MVNWENVIAPDLNAISPECSPSVFLLSVLTCLWRLALALDFFAPSNAGNAAVRSRSLRVQRPVLSRAGTVCFACAEKGRFARSTSVAAVGAVEVLIPRSACRASKRPFMPPSHLRVRRPPLLGTDERPRHSCKMTCITAFARTRRPREYTMIMSAFSD
jgi:hypothetical protein